ncbi:MAG: Mrp/NBP35 family ATP-binding protein, partial [Halobacteriales archaeon]
MSPDEDEVRAALRSVEDPLLEGDVVSLGLVDGVRLEGDTAVVTMALNAPVAPAERAIGEGVRDAIETIGLESDVRARVDETHGFHADVLPGVKNVVAVASGKGGVGKTTIATTLAAGLTERGARVGLLDADVHGPNAPRLLPTDDEVGVFPTGDIRPPEADGVRVMSAEYLLPADPDEPAALRGPMVNNVMMKFVDEVQWGYLDYLVVDLPPGTGDAALNLVQSLPVAGAVIVTTPQAMAVDDARRTMGLFRRHDVPVLGLVENMSGYRCPGCGEEHPLFGSGEALEGLEARTLARIPAHPALSSERTDDPPVRDAEHPIQGALLDLVDAVADEIGRVNRRRVAR